jgi:NAD(P)-dependent dehydrogenase (short-subunit alcohol dehydrogenase family)
MKTVVITGASSGIGAAAAHSLVQKGYRVFGSVRGAEDAQRLQGQLGQRFAPLLFDVTDHEAITRAAGKVRKALAGEILAGLVNSAGLCLFGPLMHVPLKEFQEQMAVNVIGLLDVTQTFLPLLGATPGTAGNSGRSGGRIINISSVSGKTAYPFMAAYAASKHAVEGMSDGLRRELMLYGIDVILIEPGVVRTSMVDKVAAQIDRYGHTDYGPIIEAMKADVLSSTRRAALPVERVTALISKALEHPRPRTRYPVPLSWLIGWFFPRRLPARVFDRLVAKRLGIM